MAWCFSTRASVATVLTTYLCVSRCLRVKSYHVQFPYSWWWSRCVAPRRPDEPQSAPPPGRHRMANTVTANWHWHSTRSGYGHLDKKVEQHIINTLRPKQNGHHFTDNIFKCILWNEYVWVSNKISLKFVPKGPINNIPALAQIMAWHQPSNKPLSEQMMIILQMQICVTQPQWVKLGTWLSTLLKV